jgi:acetyl-CoA C-acetyltransferase
MRDVAIIGVGANPRWGELWGQSLRDIFVEAALAAIDDAGVDHLDGMYVGCMSSGIFTGQEHLASLMSDYLGQKHIPATRVESACASGGLAVKSAFLEVASGYRDIILAGGVEKMTDVSGGEATFALGTAADGEYEGYHGATFPGLYAMIAKAHMARYGTTHEMLAQVAVKNHANGMLNPMAQYRSEITVQQVLNSVMIAEPLHILDCSPITDGAAAVILCPLDMAKKISKKQPVKIAGVGHATDTIQLAQRPDPTWLESTALAAEAAFKMAGVSRKDIDLYEVHDCFTIAELAVIEALGLVDKGKSGEATLKGRTARTGDIPVNVSGGLKSKGHPVGATGAVQIVELTRQLRGEAGERQIAKARRALAQNMGGSGGSAVVHILEVA